MNADTSDQDPAGTTKIAALLPDDRCYECVRLIGDDPRPVQVIFPAGFHKWFHAECWESNRRWAATFHAWLEDVATDRG